MGLPLREEEFLEARAGPWSPPIVRWVRSTGWLRSFAKTIRTSASRHGRATVSCAMPREYAWGTCAPVRSTTR